MVGIATSAQTASRKREEKFRKLALAGSDENKGVKYTVIPLNSFGGQKSSSNLGSALKIQRKAIDDPNRSSGIEPRLKGWAK